MKKRNVAALSILGATILALGFFATPLMRHARAATWNAFVGSTARIFGIRGTSISDSELNTITTLTKDNIRLRHELIDYRTLKAQLGTPTFDTFQKIPAAVVARPIDTLNSTYIINKGIADGVPEGAPVVVMGSVLVGFVKGLTAHSSTVETLFAPSTSITVETLPTDEGTNPARGLLKSRFQTSLHMNTIPRDAVVQEGQQIVTSNKEALIPSGMAIGTVSSLSKPENAAYQEAVVDVPYNIDSVDAVVILAAP